MMGSNGFPPKGWALCNGQLLPINQNQALFSLLGTTYGGNGTTNFALPNLQSQVPIHFGQGAGLSSYVLGQAGGAPSVTIDQSTMPAHNHLFNVTTANASAAAIGNTLLPAVPTVTNAAFYAEPGIASAAIADLGRGFMWPYRRQPAAQQYDAFALYQFHHRPSGHFPVA